MEHFFSTLYGKYQGSISNQIKVTSHLQRPKTSIFFIYLNKLNSNIQPNVSIKKIVTSFVISLKAYGLFRKNVFSNKS